MTDRLGSRVADDIIAREGGYVYHPSDRGGPTTYGITEAVARANGYRGPMPALPREQAHSIYLERYWTAPNFHLVADLSGPIAAEIADSGVNFGTSVPSVWLQRWLTAFNRQGRDYPDLRSDGAIGPITLKALGAFLDRRGSKGEAVMVSALNCTQGNRYLELAEGREKNEDFLFGWVAHRVMAPA